MTIQKIPQILAVGPLPPPLNGTSVSFEIFCHETNRHPHQLRLEVVNSAPKKLGQTPLLTAAHFTSARRIFWQFSQKIKQADQTIIFGSNQFLSSMAPICLSMAKLAGKPCYLRAFGGSLDSYYRNLSPGWRLLFHLALRHADGLIVQTQLLYDQFTQLLGDKVYYVPGYRTMPESTNDNSRGEANFAGNLRLVFLGHVREEKGVFCLLECLRFLGTNGSTSIQCDIFGPIYDSIADRFQQELAQTINAEYKGVLSPDQVVPTLRHYDVLVFPSYYQGEGHPGVVIEAMMAGIPVITTAFRSIPEVVQDRVNGLLVRPQDPHSLIEAIRLLDYDRQLVADMANRNWEMRSKHNAVRVAPQILQPLGIQL